MSIFTILKQPVSILVTIFSNLIKVTNDRFIFYIKKCVNFVNQVYFHFTTEGSLVDKIDLQAFYLSGTYRHKTGTRPPSCQTPRQPTKYDNP